MTTMFSELSKQHLMTALGRMAMVIPGKSPKDVLMSVLLEFGDGYLTMSGTDLTKAMTIKIPCESPVLAKSLTNFVNLKTMISRFTGKDISIGLEKKEILLSDGQSKFKVPTESNVSEFPRPMWHSDSDVRHTIAIEASDLIDRIAHVMHAADPKGTKFAASSVCLIDSGGQLRIICLDGRRISFSDIPKASSGVSEITALIPVEAARSMIEIFRGIEGTMKLYITESSVYIYTETIDFCCRQNEGRLPRITNYLKEAASVEMHLLSGFQLYNMAKQASCVCEEEKFGIDMKGQDGQLSLYIKTAKGEFDAKLSCDSTMDFTVSAWFLMDALSKAPPECEVSIGCTGTAGRLVIKKVIGELEVTDIIQGMG